MHFVPRSRTYEGSCLSAKNKVAKCSCDHVVLPPAKSIYTNGIAEQEDKFCNAYMQDEDSKKQCLRQDTKNI